MKTYISGFLFLACYLSCGTMAAAAGNYPDKPVRIIVPFAAGGGGDYIARSFADKFAEVIKQPVIVENHGGGHTVIGTEMVAKAAPDGYTLLLVSPSIATNPALLPDLPYKTPEAFAPVGLVVTYAMGLAARSSLGANNIPELVSLAKNDADDLTIATSGLGSASDLASTLLSEATGIDLLTVPIGVRGRPCWTLPAGMSISPLQACLR